MRYPVAFVQLARVLSSAFDLRDVAGAMGLGLSTLYRWVPKESKGHLARRARRINDFAFIEDIARLVAACEAAALPIRESVLRLAPDALSRHPVFAQSAIARARDDGAQTAAQAVSDDAAISVETEIVPSDDMFLVKTEIDEHYQRPLSCDDLARVAGMPKFSFIRKFTSTFSVSPYRYLINVRVQHAKQLLPLTDQSLESIAVAVGFGSTSSMQRAFRRFTGASPGNFMALAGQSPSQTNAAQPSAKFLAAPMIAA